MKFKLLLLLLFLFHSLFSQKKDEGKIFIETFKKDSINYDFIKGLCLIDTSYNDNKYINYKANIDAFIEKLPKKEKTDKKEKKRIKKIYDLIHKKYFVKYNIDAYFNDIFINGNYNCVTATAIYVYIFEKINIPFYIKELPSHVFLIAYPNKYKIHLETTVPGSYGFYIPKDDEIKKIIDDLIKTKLYTKSDLNKKGYQKLYMEYFYGNESINKSNLIGMQYYNKSLFNFEKNDINNALKNITNSLVFYENPLSKAILIEIIKKSINQKKFNKKEDVNLIFNALQILKFKKGYEPIIIKLLFYKIVEDDNNDLEFIENLIPLFENLSQKELSKFCFELTIEYLADQHLVKQNYNKSLEFSTKIIESNPKSKPAKEMIIYALANINRLLVLNEENLYHLNNYINEYPFLMNDKRIVSILARYYGQLTFKKFNIKEEKNALNYFNKFNNLIKEKKELIQINQNIIIKLYLTTGRHFYGISQFEKAKIYFEKGLKVFPESEELKKMLRWTLEDMK